MERVEFQIYIRTMDAPLLQTLLRSEYLEEAGHLFFDFFH